jgi:hypothetical protein
VRLGQCIVPVLKGAGQSWSCVAVKFCVGYGCVVKRRVASVGQGLDTLRALEGVRSDPGGQLHTWLLHGITAVFQA